MGVWKHIIQDVIIVEGITLPTQVAGQGECQANDGVDAIERLKADSLGDVDLTPQLGADVIDRGLETRDRLREMAQLANQFCAVRDAKVAVRQLAQFRCTGFNILGIIQVSPPCQAHVLDQRT